MASRLQDRIPWETGLKEMLKGDFGFSIESEEATDSQTVLRIKRNEQRYVITITPTE